MLSVWLGSFWAGCDTSESVWLSSQPTSITLCPLNWQTRDRTKLAKNQTGWREQGWWLGAAVGGRRWWELVGRKRGGRDGESEEGELGRKRMGTGVVGWCGFFSLEGLSRKAGLELLVWKKCFLALTHTGDGCLLLLSRHGLVGWDGVALSWGESRAAADQSSSMPGTEPAAPSSLLRSCQQTSVSRLSEMHLLLPCWFRLSLGTYSCAVYQFPFFRYSLVREPAPVNNNPCQLDGSGWIFFFLFFKCKANAGSTENSSIRLHKLH